MAIETERKFLVSGEFRSQAVKHYRITQTYLPAGGGLTIRLRITEDKAALTIKSQVNSNLLSRKEWNIDIPLSDALEMRKICKPGIVEKTRYLVPAGTHVYEVDVFHGKNEGLIIAEIELSAEDESFIKPVWLGEEVTGNPAYYSSNLIK
jgi:CYTH domain-containing protein